MNWSFTRLQHTAPEVSGSATWVGTRWSYKWIGVLTGSSNTHEFTVCTRLPPALRLKTMKHRALESRWHQGMFPVHNRYLPSIGPHIYLDDWRSLSQKKVPNLELRKIWIALTVISSIPELDSLTARESWLVWRLAAYFPRRSFLLI